MYRIHKYLFFSNKKIHDLFFTKQSAYIVCSLIKTYHTYFKVMPCLESNVFNLNFSNAYTIPRRGGPCSSTWLRTVDGASAAQSKGLQLG